MQARIKSKRELAKGTLLVELDLSPHTVTFKAGQFFCLNLVNPPYNDDKGTRRFFSIVSSPKEKSTLALATRLRDSAFKKSLQELSVGAEVDIEYIKGKFLLPEDQSRPLVFIAGGIGITPFICMLRYIQEESLSYKVTLLYSNRNRASTAFFEELREMADQNQNCKLVLTMTEDPSWDGERRRIDANFIRDHVANPEACTYYIAGPSAMVKAMTQVLSEIGIGKSRIVTEDFTGY